MDDTDVEHLNMNQSETVTEAHAALQESINNWGRLLIATGGALKPEKCFYHVICFMWNQDRSWRYASNDTRGDLGIVAPLADGSHLPIEHLPVSTPTKTLELMKCPTGCSLGATCMDRQGQRWGSE